MANKVPTCAHCNETAVAKNITGLKTCAGCKTTRYCSRDCQKADWKMHKKVCAESAADSFEDWALAVMRSSTYRPDALEGNVADPFERLDHGTYLHDRPQIDVFRLLIDSFRMRQADDFRFENKITPHSVYAGAPSSAEPFRQYLEAASARRNLLPPWWTIEKGNECVVFGESGAWNDLRKKTTAKKINEHYGNDNMRLQLRMLSEFVYGTGTKEQGSSIVRKLYMDMEIGDLTGHPRYTVGGWIADLEYQRRVARSLPM